MTLQASLKKGLTKKRIFEPMVVKGSLVSLDSFSFMASSGTFAYLDRNFCEIRGQGY